MKTIRDVTFDLLRAFEITTIFGNVGSTEETFLKNFPSDFRYILGLQEAKRRPALVNVHTNQCAPRMCRLLLCVTIL